MLSNKPVWAKIVAKNPSWVKFGADLSSALLNLFEEVFEAGYAAGVENGRAMAIAALKRPKDYHLSDSIIHDYRKKG